MRIGTLDFNSNLTLAPLAGYTGLPFRLVVRELGGLGLATTDLINARSLIESRIKAFKLVETRPEDHPLAIQLFGSKPDEMRAAAQVAESMGADVIDINMGCPVRKVCQVGGGSAMMVELEKTAALAKGMVDAVRIPVTAKMRLGWDAQNQTAPDLAKALQDAGIAAITVHGRTRDQGFTGGVNLEGIASVVRSVSIPVIGNGDVTTPSMVARMIQETGCAGVAIGRGAFYNPWIFLHTLEFIRTGIEPAEPPFEERIRVMTRHLDYMVEIYGENPGCRMFRKIAPMYARRFGPSKEFTRRIVLLGSRAEYDDILSHYRQWRLPFLDENGNLKPSYRPAPMKETFDNGPSTDTADQTIPVPKGTSEWW